MPNIEFISYDGSFPNLCYGTLTVKIDGVEHTFGSSYNGAEYPRFWCSGGSVSFDKEWNPNIETGDWELPIHIEDMFDDDNIKAILPDLINLMNDNVPKGCFGGCV